MKRGIILLSIVFYSLIDLKAVGTGTISNVKIGSTKADIQAAIGGVKASKEYDVLKGTIADKQGDLAVRASFDHGICNMIKYASSDHKKICPEVLSTILFLNSNGVKWAKQWSIKSKESFRSLDGKCYACVTHGNEVFVIEGSFFNKSMNELKDGRNSILKN